MSRITNGQIPNTSRSFYPSVLVSGWVIDSGRVGVGGGRAVLRYETFFQPAGVAAHQVPLLIVYAN